MAGWRTQISYQSWPSRDLHVDFLPTDWPLPAAQQVLDSDLSEESYALSLQKNVQNWGLELRNGADESSPDPTAESYNSGPIPSFGVPPAYGALAPERWVTPPRESPERRVLADTVQTKFRVPPIAVEEEPDILSGTESVAIGPVRLVVGEDGINKQEELLVFEVYQSPSDSNWYAVHSRYPQPPEYDGSKTVGHMPGWASAPYERQVLRRASQRKLEGDFIDIGEQPVGDPAHLVEMLGKKWMPFESKREVGRLLSTIVMQRPTAVTTEPARGTIPESLPWQITNPKGEYRTLDRGNGQEDWVLLHWERTPIAEAVELWYNVELKDTTASSPSFFTVAEVNEATFSTAATYQAKSAGSGGASYSDGDIVARVRPVKGLDRVSGRNVPVAGDWLQFDVRAA